MFVLMRQYPSGGNQHNIYYSERPEGVTDDPEVAEKWDKDFGLSGKTYHVEVEEIIKPKQSVIFKNMKIDFNINEYVLVKLTEEGKRLLREDHYKFWESVGRKDYPYIEPKEDYYGYSKWQLWNLMEKLGRYCSLGCEVPFDTNIIFIKK